MLQGRFIYIKPTESVLSYVPVCHFPARHYLLNDLIRLPTFVGQTL
jgi:hypothetical protein